MPDETFDALYDVNRTTPTGLTDAKNLHNKLGVLAAIRGTIVYIDVNGKPKALAPGTEGQGILYDANGEPVAANLSSGGAAALIIEDQKSNGTNGGTATAGSYQIRDLNTEVQNDLAGSGIVYELAYDAQTANFTVGDILTGGTSGATATIVADTDGGATGTLKVTAITGTFQDNETITDASGGSATSNIPSGVVNNNEFTVSVAGDLLWECPCYGGSLHATRLWNVTDGVLAKKGTARFSRTAGDADTVSKGKQRIVAGKIYRIEHRVTATVATLGFGTASSFGDTEVYSRVEFTPA